MDINGRTALVTGANRGLGKEFVTQLLERGAAKVYATARDPETVDLRDDRVRALALDITDPAQVTRVAEQAGDVDLLVNNAGITTLTNLVTGPETEVRRELDTHFFGSLHTTRAFAPILAARGGGAIVNVMSVLSFFAYPGNGAYSVGKAAQWQLTNSTRLELLEQGTQVLGAHLSSTDTDMMAGWDVPKNDPVDVVRAVLDALEAGASEVLADAETQDVKRRLSGPPEEMYPQLLDAGPR